MILLIHHADAVGPEIDPMRPLSVTGRAQATRVAEAIAARHIVPELIWHSGKLRGRQTAEAVWRVCNPLARVSAVRGLQPDDPPAWIADQLAGETRHVALVGHMPHLPRLLSVLVRDGGIAFPPHGCVALEAGDGGWSEAWRVAVQDVRM
jgi:phosphohistidine phosphatase